MLTPQATLPTLLFDSLGQGWVNLEQPISWLGGNKQSYGLLAKVLPLSEQGP